MADGNRGGVGVRLYTTGDEVVRRNFDQVGDSGRRMWTEIAAGERQVSPGLRAVNNLSNEAKDALGGMAAAGGPVGRALASIGPLGLAAGAALGVFALGLQQARQAMDFAQDLEAASAQIGLNTDALQEWRHVAREAGVDVGTMDSALAAFNRTLGSATSGISREALTAFERLGFTREQLQAFGSAEEALEAVIDRVAGLGDAAEQAAIAQKLNIEPILPVLRQGSDEIERLRQEAQDLGVVMDAELVRRAADAGREFDTLSQVIDIQLKSAFVDLAPVLVDLIRLVADLASGLARALDGFRRLEDRSTTGLRDQLDSLEAENRALLARATSNGRAGSPTPGRRGQGIDDETGLPINPELRAEAERNREERNRISALLMRRDVRTPPPTGDGELLDPPSRSRRRGSSAEAEARRAEMRRRALEDLAAEIALMEARERGDTDALRLIERQNEERRYTRRLLDQQIPAEEAQVQVAEIMARLDAARAAAQERALSESNSAFELEQARLLGDQERVRELERQADLQARINAYVAAGLGLEDATQRAGEDQARLDEARSAVLARWLDQQAQAHDLTLAQLSGDEARVRQLQREVQLRERIEELQKAGVDLTEAEAQARREDQERETARIRGQFREGARAFVEGVVSGDLRSFWENMADRFTDRIVDRLTDDLMNLFDQLVAQLGQANLGGKGGGGPWDLIGSVLGFGGGGGGGGLPGLGKGGFGGFPGKAPMGAPLGIPGGKGFDPLGGYDPSAMGAAPAMSFSFTYAPSYDVKGSGEEISALRRDMEQDRRDFEGRVVRTVQQANQRTQGEVFRAE